MGSGSGGPSNVLLILGIVIDVTSGGLAIWWPIKQGVKKDPPKEARPNNEPPENQP